MPDTKPKIFRIVETDNFDGDHPYEVFATTGALKTMTNQQACAIANAMNDQFPPYTDRFWKVVEDGYKLNREDWPVTLDEPF
jgi:hypothetical protein